MKRRMLLCISLLLMTLILACAPASAGEEPLTIDLEEAIRIAVRNSKDIDLAEYDLELARIALLEVETSGLRDVAQSLLDLRRQSVKDAEEAYIESIQTLALNVEKGCYSLLKAIDNLENSKRAVERLQRQNEIAELKYQGGLISKAELNNIKDALKQAVAGVRNSEFALVTEKMNFNLLLGIDLGTEVVLKDEFEYMPLEIDLDEAIDYATKNSRSIRNLIRLYDEAKKQLANTDNDFTPLVEKRKAKIELEKAEIKLNQALRTIQVSIRKAYSVYLTASHNVEVKTDALKRAEEEIEIVKKKFDAGLVAMNSVLDAENALAEAEIALAQAIYDYNIAKADLYRSMGREYVKIDELIKEGIMNDADL